MGIAFSCDACDQLESGKPAQTVTVAPMNGTAESLQLCMQCLASHNDWRVSRAPKQDAPMDSYTERGA